MLPFRRLKRVAPFATAVPFWGLTTQGLSSLSPKRGCSPQRFNSSFFSPDTEETSSESDQGGALGPCDWKGWGSKEEEEEESEVHLV